MAVLGASSLTGCSSIPGFIAGGSLMLFQQTAAPLSWTKQTTHNNKALRVISTGTATPGGSTAFTSVFASRPVTGSVSVSVSGGSVGNHTLGNGQIPNHTHPNGSAQVSIFAPIPTPASPATTRNAANSSTGGVNEGSGGAHSHPFSVGSASGSFSGTALNFAVQYVDIIICSKI